MQRRLDELERQMRELKPSLEQPHKKGEYEPELVPFQWGDFRWMPGNYAPSESHLKAGPFTGEVRMDVAYHYSFANPKDDTISGSSEVFRHREFQVTQIGVGGDFYYEGAMARFMTQFGMYSQTTPRNDASPGRGARRAAFVSRRKRNRNQFR